MAVDESGKQARLIPCLAILRYTVATVVTVLAVVVIVMVIAVGVRPDNVSVSVVQGHVVTSDLWNETSPYVDEKTTVELAGKARSVGRPCFGAGRSGGGAGAGGSIKRGQPCVGAGGSDGGAGFGSYGRPTRTVYTPVEALSLDVALSVDNQSGRGSISCRSINITFRAGGGMAAGMEIGVLRLPSSLDFRVKPQTSHKISRLVTFDNATVLKYIANTYGGESSFTGTVEVTMNASSVVLGHHNPFSIVTFVCSQVDFSVFDAIATATSVQCTKSN